ncbi:MAG TPA: DUF2169 domain-containing protein [Thermoanaerobaculia bacterium]|nr:DUF2169 domain-containing protein [Thermoanaerobaculia bacterium]
MLQLRNRSRFAATLLPLPDAAGLDSLFVVVKGTFTLGARPAPVQNQVPVCLRDEYLGNPGQSSVTQPSDVSLAKPATDVLLRGHAYAPGGQPASRVPVALVVGSIRKRAEVFGDRVWEGGLVSARASAPKPFERVPLLWERSFGGASLSDGQLGTVEAEERNPVGAGFRGRKTAQPIEGTRLPNVEDPQNLMTSPRDRPAPVGFGPIAPHWQPRRSYAGTYDERWQRERAPFLPKDFDPRFLQVAPPDQTVPGYLKGGEEIHISGVTPLGSLASTVPGVRIQILFRLDETNQARAASLDTLMIEPDEGRMVLVWRAVLTADKRILRVREVEVSAKGEEA